MSNQKNSYLVIARKYRPKKFSEVVGQDHVIQTLRNAIMTGRIAHAYLLVGPRGIGKTTIARLLAASLNTSDATSVDTDPQQPNVNAILEGRSLDVREIDGASNNGVEQVRELRDDVRYPPQSSRYKIYIIDEVHMLSTAAFNALLKTLEEPPYYVKFIFATTESHKVPATIMSRCQRFDLRRIPTELIVQHLMRIAEAEGIKVEIGALQAIARLADGGLRDAQSILDQMISYCGETIRESDVVTILGIPPRSAVIKILSHVLKGEIAPAWEILRNLDNQGKDFARILSDMVSTARELLVSQQAPEVISAEISAEHLASLEPLKFLLKPTKLLRLVEFLSTAESRMRFVLQPRIWLEITLASAAQISKEVDLDDIITALSRSGVQPVEPPFLKPQYAQTLVNPSQNDVNTIAQQQNAKQSYINSSTTPKYTIDKALEDFSIETSPQISVSSTPITNTPNLTSYDFTQAAHSNQKEFIAASDSLRAWQILSQRLPSYLLQGITAAPAENNLSISVDSKIIDLLEKEWPRQKIEKELRTIYPNLQKISWQTHTSLAPSKLTPPDQTLSSSKILPPKKTTKKSGADSPGKKINPATLEDNNTTKIPFQDMEEFYNDQQIKKALEQFGARLLEIKKCV